MPDSLKKIAVSYIGNNNDAASKLANELAFPFVDPENKDYDYLLVKTTERLEIRCIKQPKLTPFAIDFSQGKLGHRLQQAVGRKELIAKAVGIKKGYRPFIIDTTAGLARDGFLLACLGCKMLLLERSKILFALVNDGLQRFFLQHPQFSAKLLIDFKNIDAIDFLSTETIGADVIYLDPMLLDDNYLYRLASIRIADNRSQYCQLLTQFQRVYDWQMDNQSTGRDIYDIKKIR